MLGPPPVLLLGAVHLVGGRVEALAHWRLGVRDPHLHLTALLPSQADSPSLCGVLYLRNLEVPLVRRHMLALVLAVLVLVSVLWSLPPVVDAVTGGVPGEADLVRPFLYLALAPVSNLLDALTFFSLERALVFVVCWAAVLAAWAALATAGRRWWRRVLAGVGGAGFVLLVGAAAALAPRPVPRLTARGAVTVLDYHAHTSASHDGRGGFGPAQLAQWHALQGFGASYVTDHNTLFTLPVETAIPLLPAVEWSVHRQHVVALGPVREIERSLYSGTTARLLGLFGELHRQGGLGLASLPEYWDNHREDLELFVASGVDGFEIVNCSPKGLRFPSTARRSVIELAAPANLLVVGASDTHGWGRVTCVWNLSRPGAEGFRANQVLARPIALAQGDAAAWSAPVSQLWLMLRGLEWDERIAWLTWIAVITIYRAVPRRSGKRAGLGILARDIFGGPRSSGTHDLPRAS